MNAVAPVPARKPRPPIIAACSLLLAIFFAVEWYRSYHVADVAAVFLPGGFAECTAAHQGQQLFLFSDVRVFEAPASAICTRVDVDAFSSTRQFLEETDSHHAAYGFGISAGRVENPTDHDSYAVLAAPHWFLILIALPLPIVQFRRMRLKHSRRRAGLCVHCGYDLRASSGRCPECGADTSTDKLVGTQIMKT